MPESAESPESAETAAEAAVPVTEPDASIVPDAVLLASVDLGLDALREIAPENSVGAPAGHLVEDEHTLSLLFECRLPGYPGWFWTVTLARVDDESAPTVLEAELMPGDTALVAPDWIPWSERLADYRAAQDALRAAKADEDGSSGEDEGDESDDDLEDDVDEDDDDVDDEDDDVDVDGLDVDVDDLDVDVDELDVDALDDDELDHGFVDDADADPALGDEELAALDREVDDSDDSEDESDDRDPDPPAESVVVEVIVEHEQSGEHESPDH
jgi:hypothetical protein